MRLDCIDITIALGTGSMKQMPRGTPVEAKTGESGIEKRDFLDLETLGVRSVEVGKLLCYEVLKWTGAFAPVLSKEEEVEK